jgi:hypothetical protein
VKYKFTLPLKAYSTNPTATDKAARAIAMNINLFWRGFILFLITCITHHSNLLQSDFPFVYDHCHFDYKYKQRNSI